LISLSTSFAGIGDSGFVRKVADGFMAVFLLVNLVIRFSSIFYYTPYNGYIAVFLGCVVLACAWVVVFQRFLMVYLFIFGFSFFLFGFGSFEIQSRVFEILVTCVASTLFLINCGNLSCTLHPAPFESAKQNSGGFDFMLRGVVRVFALITGAIQKSN